MRNLEQDLSDEDLACLVQAGADERFEELLRRHQARVFNFLRILLRQDQDAEDVTQTTFVAAYRAIGRYRRRWRFQTWLFTIARRQAISFHRAHRPTEPLAEEPVDPRTPDQPVTSREDFSRLWALARAILPAPQAGALWLRYGEDLSVRQVAQAMGRPVPQVKVLLHRARKKLAAELDGRAAARAPAPGMMQERA